VDMAPGSIIIKDISEVKSRIEDANLQ
jgi:hypothetical protein